MTGAEPVEKAVHRLLASHGTTVAVAESLTGGLVGQRLSATPGASSTFRGDVVAYATGVKAAVLGVPESLLADRGAVDADIAFAMASGARRVLTATYGLGLTGVAGPDPAEGKLPGTVHVSFAGPDGQRVDTRLELHGDRSTNRAQAAEAALDLLCRHLPGFEERA